MTHRISLHEADRERDFRNKELALFWKYSRDVSELCRGVLDDSGYKRLLDLRDEIDVIAIMTDRHTLRESAQKRVDEIDHFLKSVQAVA